MSPKLAASCVRRSPPRRPRLDTPATRAFYDELVEVSGRPILFNATAVRDDRPSLHRRIVRWTEETNRHGRQMCNQTATKSKIVHDFPGGEWRRVQYADGYRWIMVNGEVTFEDGTCTGGTPDHLLRHGHG